MTIPKGYQAVMPYLILNDAAKFSVFASTVFNVAANNTRPTADGQKIMHSEITIDGCTIMFCDASEQWAAQPTGLFVYVENADITYQKALDAGGTSVMELSDQDYGRTCGVKDPTGNTWWITSVIA